MLSENLEFNTSIKRYKILVITGFKTNEEILIAYSKKLPLKAVLTRHDMTWHDMTRVKIHLARTYNRNSSLEKRRKSPIIFFIVEQEDASFGVGHPLNQNSWHKMEEFWWKWTRSIWHPEDKNSVYTWPSISIPRMDTSFTKDFIFSSKSFFIFHLRSWGAKSTCILNLDLI